MKDTNQLLKKTPVAIVGMASCFADSENLEKYWENIIQGVDCIKEVPDDRWKISDYYDPDPFAEDKTYCKVGGFIPKIDFNPMEFGLPPNILEVTDASQLLGLAVAKDALTDAGYAPGSEELKSEVKERTGVILGVGGGQKLIIPLTARLQYPIWRRALESMGMPEEQIAVAIEKMKAAFVPWTENSFPGLLGNVISGRIANRFDFGGINSVVDAACAASLSAIKMAVSELIEKRADMMVTGGVDTDNSPFMYMSFSKTPAFSRKGSIRPFDHESDGMLIGEGVGMMVMKRLEDAERDGDKIYAVINGIGGSSDGRYKSVYAPRPSGQALAMDRAYEEAGYDASTVGLIEAHGTGTGAGDASEGESMKMVFGKNSDRLNHIALGSVKSQIGHTKAAAGAAGMIKAALSLHHKILPGTINVTKPNPKVNIETSPLYINNETRPWFQKDSATPLRAGVSAFGFGGVNLHFSLEEYKPTPKAQYRVHNIHKQWLLTDVTSSALVALVQKHIAGLKGDNAKAYYKEVSATAFAESIPDGQPRVGFVASSIEDTLKKLEAFASGIAKDANVAEWKNPILNVWYRNAAYNGKNNVAALFAGQGSQYVNMGGEIAWSFPDVRDVFVKANETFEASNKSPLTETVYPIPVFSDEERKQQQATLTATENAQPAIGALSVGMYHILKNAGFNASFFAGHSYGELSALYASGAIDLATFLTLSKERGQAMSAQAGVDAGTMMAVKADVVAVQPYIGKYKNVQVANINSGTQVILGGAVNELTALKAELKAAGLLATILPVSAAFHTPFVGHASKPFAAVIDNANIVAPKGKLYSNTLGTAYPAQPQFIKETLKRHILSPVLFKDQIEKMYQEGARVFVEFGPKNILSNLTSEILAGKDHQVISLNANAKKNSEVQLREAAVQLAVMGIALQNFDPYARPVQAAGAKSKMNVQISGTNYLTPAFKKRYQDILEKGGKVLAKKAPLVEEIETVIAETTDMSQVIEEKLRQKQNSASMAEKAVLDQIQADIQRLTEQQSRIEQMLSSLFNMQTNNQLESAAAPVQQQIASPVETPVAPAPVAAAPVTPTPAPVVETPAAGGVSNAEIEASLLVVIAEKTGYPSEMLEMEMDMEADLGIDSIKRVEIFGAMTEANPSVQGVDPQELAELRTLAQIAEYISGKAGATSAPAAAPAPVAAEPVTPTPAPVAVTPAAGGVTNAEIEASLLVVIAEKTGYPSEMLEMEMDMEADLGIDSIKRVEIFGAMTEANPSVQGVDPQELAELRTLAQIAEYISGKAGATSAPAAAPAPVAAAPVTPTPAPVVETPSAGGVTNAEIEASLLVVIAEKTGYPSEMLEMEMDMEADLGIDSIKRVEIFGAMTEANPSVQGVDPQELAELRTLAQIAEYISGKAGATSAPAAAPAPVAAEPVTPTPAPVAATPAAGGVTNAEIEASLLEVIAEKTGYPSEMLEMEMDMEADLGIDSIKRVEIFGAMTEANPSVQGVDPQELAELRTLAQIAEYISGKAGATSAPAAAPAPVAAAPVAATPAAGGVTNAEIEASLLEVIAEKTGYPSEMLEMEMDMEADLGIDSIKRVEIFGAMTEANPSVQGVDPQELAELRTLAQIAEYISGKAGATTSSTELEKKKSTKQLEEVIVEDHTSFVSGNYDRVPRSSVQVKYIPEPDQLVIDNDANAWTVMTNDGSGLSVSLAQELLAEGRNVAVLTMPSSLVRQAAVTLPQGAKELQLSDVSDDAIKSALAQIGGVDQFIYVHPHFRFPLGQWGMHFDKEKELLKSAYLLAKHLKPSLNDYAAKSTRASFMTVTRLEGAFGTKNPGNVSVIGGGLFGLTKSMNLEWTNVFCRAVDLSSQLKAEVAAKKVIAELKDADVTTTETAYNDEGKRFTLQAVVEPHKAGTVRTSSITSESVFLVTGGAKGVTADCVRAMAKTYKSKFILVGRSALTDSEPAWAQGVADEPALKRNAMMALKEAGEKPLPKAINKMVGAVLSQREIQENLAYIESVGAKAYYTAADVTNAEALKAAVEPIVAQAGKITGIIHGAGRLADKLIENKTATDFDNVYDVKISGLLAAVAAGSIHDIKHVVLFSSVAGFYGNVGQSDYAMANEVLNRVAHLFKKNHPDVHIASINWGAWDAGMVSGELKKMFEAYGVALVPSEEGPVAMVDQLSDAFADQPQVILGGTLPLAKADLSGDLKTYTVKRNMTEEKNPFLQHHMIQGNAVLPIVNASTWMVQTATDLYPGFNIQRVDNAKLFKGIVFDGKQAEDYTITVKETSKSEDTVTMTVNVSSNNGGKLPLNHYQTQITLTSKGVEAPVVALPNTSAAPAVADASSVYTDGTLFHGSDFNGIKSILEMNEKNMVFLCEHDGVTEERQGQVPVKKVNPYLMDIMYQGAVVWVRRFHGAASLPLSTEYVEIFDALPFGKPFYVQIEVKKADDFSMVSDITAYDAETGKVYMKSYGAAMTISRELTWS
ncbi:type I polyketide synthase [Flammeovirga kamogawensis]|uniref:type I polyketide synthase n=1 Tax=Flammeovirga kamogawensis TaxID=373891 RepID=UPI0011845D4F|nr:type I polyketide synthase [Flammeovirga kamogawensis]MBB6460043.1 acyl transferase domain-containing protein/NAD(P)-dependent dehydrogenase (short-subunit alcohol dehydrogenase family) [Flammeovirga kamogawensis]TRX68732.1 SDR family NAD(P)-dependent oxidoreductase [Flammeovirga kamogawensis]